jgi:hypothetical protein
MCDGIKLEVVMVKAVVVDIKGKYAVVLDKQGCFKKIRNSGQLRVGYEIEIPRRSFASFGKLTKVASVAAVFVTILGLSYGVHSYRIPYSYVNVDINPSIEITTNIFDRIIKVEGLNEDGRKLVEAGAYVNKRIESGVELVLEAAVKEGYIRQESYNTVIFTVSSRDEVKVDGIQKSLKDTVSQELEAAGAETEVLIEKVEPEKRAEAERQGVSPGKLNLINKLLEVNPEVEVGDLKEKTVKEIMESIKESRKELREQKSGEKIKNSNANNKKTEDKVKKDNNSNIRYFVVKPKNVGQFGKDKNDKDNKKDGKSEKIISAFWKDSERESDGEKDKRDKNKSGDITNKSKKGNEDSKDKNDKEKKEKKDRGNQKGKDDNENKIKNNKNKEKRNGGKGNNK